MNTTTPPLKIDQLKQKIYSNSLSVYSFGMGCCAEEAMITCGAIYDVERLGIKFVSKPEDADVLLIGTAVTQKLKNEITEAFEKMFKQKFVIALGSCAISGGIYQKRSSYAVEEGVEKLLPVDVFIPGCPPRPEAVMFGLIKLQEKINGYEENSRTHRTTHR